MENFDSAIIGAGPGGYVAAILAAKRGMKVALVEKYSVLGGTCLNVGCIPSKTLLDIAEKYHEADHKFASIGIEIKQLAPNWAKMQEVKRKVIEDNVKGIDYLMKKNKVTVFKGKASLISKDQLEIKGDKETIKIGAKHILLATGSKPSSVPGVVIDKQKVISSTEALSLAEIPKKLLVIGAGVIGLELGSVFRRLGSQVSVVEFQDRILPNFDRTVSKEAEAVFKKQGLEFYLNHKVQSIEKKGSGLVLKASSPAGEKSLEADYVLVATGRKPYTEGLGLEKVGVSLDAKGFVQVDTNFQTSIPNIFAIGDVIGGMMLAHKAEEDAAYVVDFWAGEQPLHFLIPSVVYTWPEISYVGLTEEECKQKGYAYKVGQFPFKALGRARASNETDGFVKILAAEKTDEVLGCHIFGSRAADLIMEVTLAMEYKASAEDIGRICHPHPTFSEAIKEAALNAWDKRAIHM